MSRPKEKMQLIVSRARLRDTHLLVALAIAVVFHGVLLARGGASETYDAYVHIFFGNHYAENWFSTWQQRWYTGFTTVSYPPGTHHLIALLSPLFGLLGAFSVVQLAGVVLLVIGVYRYSLLWVSRQAAGWAAIAASLSSSIAVVVHVFGQLPTTVALGILLNAQPSLSRWVRTGEYRSFATGLSLVAATTACHHVTTLFGSVFFTGPVIVRALLDMRLVPVPNEIDTHPASTTPSILVALMSRRIRRVLPGILRTVVLGISSIAMLTIVVLPFWLWSQSDPIVQVPIPHGSRANFLEERNVGLIFFAIPWATTAVALPHTIFRGLRSRGWPLAASITLLFVLGTGGTTPIPRLLLRGAFDILTLDRFTFWATIAILPFLGHVITSLLALSRDLSHRRLARQCGAVLGVISIGAVVFAASLPSFRPFQPDPIDPKPIAEFLSKDDHDRWRYLALGFGDQMAWLSANTDALTVDGNYHSARRLPELTSRSIERLEGAKFRGIPGIGSLQQFLGNPAPYHLKFVFSNDEFYDPLLWASGWHRLGRLNNGTMVWEKSDIPPLPDVLPVREVPAWQRALWGIAPMTAISFAAISGLFLVSGRVFGFGRRSELRFFGRQLDKLLERLVSRLAHVRSRPIAQTGFSPPYQHPKSTGWGVIAFVIGGLVLMAGFSLADQREESSPTAAIVSFYDHIDFSRFSEAYDLLDPSSRPSAEEWTLERSIRDGLFAGYAELDGVDIEITEQTDDFAVANVELRYLTSLTEIRDSVEVELRQNNGEWRLIAEPTVQEIPPAPVVRRDALAYFSQGRRQTTDALTAHDDVLDRPQLKLGDARLVSHEDGVSVVGTVTNVDADPADVTVDAELFDDEGTSLVLYTATTTTMHKLLPGETSAYRIDFEQLATLDELDQLAGEDLDFEPGAKFGVDPAVLDETFRLDVVAKAVSIDRELDRDMGLQNLESNVEDGQITISGELRNDGVRTATVPHVIIARLDNAGSIDWVSDHWIPEAVRPQRSIPVELVFEAPSERSTVGTETNVYANGQGLADVGFVPSNAIELEHGTFVFWIDSFERTESG